MSIGVFTEDYVLCYYFDWNFIVYPRCYQEMRPEA